MKQVAALDQYLTVTGSNRSLQLFGVRLVGINAETGKKLLFTLIIIVTLLLLRWGLRAVAKRLLRGDRLERARFWARQAISLMLLLVLIVVLASIWFDEPSRLATALGLVTAGLAFALQRVVTAVAGYFVILRGRTFTVGDRITMGGVRGDVIGLGFIQTRVMEMGQPPSVQPGADPAMWVRARQYTGRIVSITNDKIFDEPVYNYTSDFPFLWEEIRLPIPYDSDRDKAELILLEATQRHTVKITTMGEAALRELERRYAVKTSELAPRVYWRLTDNWLEMAVRFLVEDHAIRGVKDRISRDVLRGLDEAGISLASGTYQVVGMPPLKVQLTTVGASG